MKITIEIQIENLDEWDVNWNDAKEVGEQLRTLNKSIKSNTANYLGIRSDTITVKTKYELI